MQKPIVLGNGIVAETVLKGLRGSAEHYTHVTDLQDPVILQDSFDGLYNPVLFNREGLSRYYHGVTPLDEFLKFIGLDQTLSKSPDFNIVPFRVPRPSVRKPRGINLEKLQQVQNKEIYACLSVVGNLVLHTSLTGDDQVWRVGDHICATVGYCDFQSKYAPKLTRYGVVHPVMNIADKMQIGFRPRVDEKLFDLIMTSGLAAKLKKISLEKLRAAAYLKLGFDFSKALDYECFVQFNMRNAYEFQQSKISLARGFKERLEKLYDEAISRVCLKKVIPYSEAKFYSGIHLSSDLHTSISAPRFLDTSLASSERHPTLAACNEVRSAI